MKYLFSIIFFLSSMALYSQSGYPEQIQDPVPFPKEFYKHPLFVAAEKLSQANQYTSAEEHWDEFILRYPDIWAGYYFSAQAKTRLQKYKEAHFMLEQAYQMNPTDATVISDYIYNLALMNVDNRVVDLGRELAGVCNREMYNGYIDYFGSLINHHQASSSTGQILSSARQGFIDQFSQINPDDNLFQYKSDVFNISGKTVEEVWGKLEALKVLYKNRGRGPACYHFRLKGLFDEVNSRKENLKIWFQTEVVKEMVREYELNEPTTDYYRAHIGLNKYRQYFGNSDYDKASALIDKLISDLASTGMFRYKLMELYQEKSRLLYEMDRNSEFDALTSQMEILLAEYKNPQFKSQTLQFLALLNKDKNFAKAEAYGLEALAIDKKNELGSQNLLKSLMSIIYYDNGDKANGLKYAGLEKNPDDMSYRELFNVGSMLQDNSDPEQALEFFLKSEIKFENYLKAENERNRLTLRAQMDPLYAGLANCYVTLNEPAKAFSVLESSKAHLLSEEMKTDFVDLPLMQGLLGKDEVFVSYKITNPSEFLLIAISNDHVYSEVRPLSFLVNAVKKSFGEALYKLDETLTKSIYQQPNFKQISNSVADGAPLVEGDFELVVEFYRKFLTGKLNEVLPTFPPEGIAKIGRILGSDFYNVFLDGIEQNLGAKSKYYLSLDGVLNFIPFDSFIGNEGNYLSESIEFKVVPNAGILKTLKNRHYSDSRNDVLAFGGAVYKNPQSGAPLVSSLAEINDWQLKSYDLVDQNKPLTDLFSAMGMGQMTYLPGTLTEVKRIKEIYPNATLLAGESMTEHKVKSLSGSGELKNYKVIHFATHGWVIGTLPAVPGLAMCIPEVSLDGEDGFLIAKEISQLKLNADMVMLSACQTGLGKLYGGEGVSGLNQSLLKAGANSTIVSLWPVDDYATSILVSELYRVNKEKGIGYSEALRAVKNNFIAGRYNSSTRDLSKPEYWAPFIYNGK